MSLLLDHSEFNFLSSCCLTRKGKDDEALRINGVSSTL